MAQTIEELEKKVDDKLEELSQDVKSSCLAEVKEDIRKGFEELKKSRDLPWADQKAQEPARVFKHYGDFLQAVAYRQSPTLGRQHEIPDTIIKAMGEATGATGGFFIPIEFKPELLKLIIEDQVVRPRARVVPMATDTLWWPRIRDVSHVSAIHGGVKGTWVAEAGTLTTGEPIAAQLQLVAKKFTDYATVSNELIMDSPISIPELISSLGKEGIGFFEDYSALFGTGVGEMKGCVTCAASLPQTRKTASHIVYADVVGMQTQLFPSSYKRAVWVCSPSAFGELLQMSLPVGTGGSAVFVTNVPPQTAVQEIPMTMFGRPLIVSEKMSALGTAGDLFLADFSYYIIGDRMELTITASEHVAFATDQTAFRIIERLDGMPWLDSYLLAKNGTDKLSAFVYLS